MPADKAVSTRDGRRPAGKACGAFDNPRTILQFQQVQGATETGRSFLRDIADMAGAEGLEPPALGFGDRCSTN